MSAPMPTAATPAADGGLSDEGEDKPEVQFKRNPYADFAAVEASRPDFGAAATEWTLHKTPNPAWKPGDGANDDDWRRHELLSIDPWAEGRGVLSNYKLMISATVPRPIALVSTVTADGRTRNLAPFSYFQAVTSDPPLYSITCTGRQANDTVRNLLATKECCISMTSEWIVEAANFASVNTPPQVSEWELAGLTPSAGEVVAAPYVAESPYSVECRYFSHQDIFSRPEPGTRTATMFLLEIVRFHIRADAVGADLATADVNTLRPVFRLGGILYGAVRHGFEIPRPDAFRNLRAGDETVRDILRRQEEKTAAA